MNNNVYDKLNSIFINFFDMDLDNIDRDLFQKNLLGSIFKLEPVDLLCIYMEVEKEFNILIPQEYVYKNKFNTIDNIMNIISVEIKKQEKIKV